MKEYTLNVNDEVYVLLPPTKVEPYRYVKGFIRNFISKRGAYKLPDSLTINLDNIDDIKRRYKVHVTNLEDSRKYYLCDVHKIYTLDEFNMLKTDIENLTKLKTYKDQLEYMYNTYIYDELEGWNPKYLPKF